MRLEFVFNPEQDVVGYTTDMHLHTTFGEEIQAFCTIHGFREQEWAFFFLPRILVPKDETPTYYNLDDQDDVTIFCIPAEANN